MTFILFVTLIILSKQLSLVFLPVVWFAHGAWDLSFLLGQVPVDKSEWVVQLCVPYDWLLAGYIFCRFPARGGARSLSNLAGIR